MANLTSFQFGKSQEWKAIYDLDAYIFFIAHCLSEVQLWNPIAVYQWNVPLASQKLVWLDAYTSIVEIIYRFIHKLGSMKITVFF